MAGNLSSTRREYRGIANDLYDRAAEKRAALARWAQMVAAILTPSPANNVVTLRR
jgi:hypothetical protein